MIELIKEAIKTKSTLSFTYKGQKRIVEPHHIGIYGDKDQIHVYQLNFPNRGWKNFIVSSILDIRIHPFTTFNPQATYNPINCKYSIISVSVVDAFINEPDGSSDSNAFKI